MKIDSHEKNLIRRLHRKHSVINEVTTGGTTYDEWACMSSQSQNPGCNGPHPGGSFNTGQLGVVAIYTSTSTSNGGYDCNQSCQPGFGYQCNPSGAPGCVQSASGQYSSLSQCQQSCGSYGDEKYNCVNNSCISVSQTDPGYSSAPFLTMDECQDSMCGERRGPINPRGPKTTIPVNNAYAKKGNVKTNLREEVSRAKLMWGYNTNLTLNENTVKQTNEQYDAGLTNFSGDPQGTMTTNTGGTSWNALGWFITTSTRVTNMVTNKGQQFACDWLLQKYNTMYAKANSFSGGQNPLWQNQVAYKLLTFYTLLQMEMCTMPTINEQDYGVKQPPQWCYDSLKPGQLQEIESGVMELEVKLAEITRTREEDGEPKGGDGRNIREQSGGKDPGGNAGAWNSNPVAYMMWAHNMNSKINNHPNPCNFMGKRKSHFEIKKLSNNPNSNNPKGPEWQQMIQTKINYFIQKETDHDNGDGTTGCV